MRKKGTPDTPSLQGGVCSRDAKKRDRCSSVCDAIRQCWQVSRNGPGALNCRACTRVGSKLTAAEKPCRAALADLHPAHQCRHALTNNIAGNAAMLCSAELRLATHCDLATASSISTSLSSSASSSAPLPGGNTQGCGEGCTTAQQGPGAASANTHLAWAAAASCKPLIGSLSC